MLVNVYQNVYCSNDYKIDSGWEIDWNSNTNLAVNESKTHGLRAQSVRSSEWNSQVLGKNPYLGQLSRATFKKFFSGDYYIYRDRYIATIIHKKFGTNCSLHMK